MRISQPPSYGARISNTCSGGRPKAALPLANTMGRSIKMGFLIMKPISSSSDKDGLSSPYSVYSASFLRIRSRGEYPSWARISFNFFCARRRFEIFDDDRRDTVFSQQLKSLTRFGTFWIVINGYRHDLKLKKAKLKIVKFAF